MHFKVSNTSNYLLNASDFLGIKSFDITIWSSE